MEKLTKKAIKEMFPLGSRWLCINSRHPHLCGPRKLVAVKGGEMCWELEDEHGSQPWMTIPPPEDVLEFGVGYLKCKLGSIEGHTLTFTAITEEKSVSV